MPGDSVQGRFGYAQASGSRLPVRRVATGQQATSGRHRILVDAPDRLDGVWDPDRLGQSSPTRSRTR